MNPDGDTLGSMCAMYSMIYNRFKKKADMNVVSNVPLNYKFLPNVDKAQRYYDKSLVYDLVISLDVAAIDRVLDSKTNPKFGDYQIINPDASSCGEVLYDYFKDYGWEIDKDAAICLYTAIMTDTGNFKFENTSASALRAAADLVDKGAVPNYIYKIIVLIMLYFLMRIKLLIPLFIKRIWKNFQPVMITQTGLQKLFVQ